MVSKSVNVKFPFLLFWSFTDEMPIIAKFFKYSHPAAPAPTKNRFNSSNFFWISLPNIDICSSYLELIGSLLISFSFKFLTKYSNSNQVYWLNGVNIPVYLIISCAITQPKNETNEEISSLDQSPIW